MRRTQKKKAPKKEPPKPPLPAPGGDHCTRLLLLALGVCFLIWFVHSQSERAALLELVSRGGGLVQDANGQWRQIGAVYGVPGAYQAQFIDATQHLRGALAGGGLAGSQYGHSVGTQQQGGATWGGLASGRAQKAAQGAFGGGGGSFQDASQGRASVREYNARMGRALDLLSGNAHSGTAEGSQDPAQSGAGSISTGAGDQTVMLAMHGEASATQGQGSGGGQGSEAGQGAEESDALPSEPASSSSSSSSSALSGTSSAATLSGTSSAGLTDAVGYRGNPRNRRWAPINGSFVLRWGKPKRRYLDVDVNKEKLQQVLLDANRFGSENALPGSKAPSASRGAPCPDFEYGYEGFPDIASCFYAGIEDPVRSPTKYPHNCAKLAETCVQETDLRPHERWTPQVLVLHNVYVNLAGQIFNSTHFFDHNSCSSEQNFQYRERRTRVLHFKELVNMIDWYAWSARSFTLELTPLWIVMARVLPYMRGIPIGFGHRLTHKRNQLDQMIAQGAKYSIGLEFDKLNYYILQGSDLFYAERLIVPLHQMCGNPSRAMWDLIRSRHFLPPGGIPMFNPDYTSTYHGHMAAPPMPSTWDNKDWVVLIAYKPERLPFLEQLQIEKKLQDAFPPERVLHYRESSLTIPRKKELLNRARVMVSAHDNVLADMVFMPPGGAVFEIRPVEDPDPNFHLLAEVCGLRYYLLFSEGYRKQLPPVQASAKLKIKDMKQLDRLIIKLGQKMQHRPPPKPEGS